jgi:hypothetical protein
MNTLRVSAYAYLRNACEENILQISLSGGRLAQSVLRAQKFQGK